MKLSLPSFLFKPLVFLAVCATGLFAQSAGTGQISGTITDPAGAVVPGARVVVHNADTGGDRSIDSNGDGIYTAPLLQPGHYEINVSKAGFAKVERKGITLEVGRNLGLDFALTVQGGAETVTVNTDAPVVDTEKTEVSQQVSQNLVENLPIVGRRWDNFALLTPGVTTDGGLVSYRGISGLYNNNAVDGANNNQAFFSEARGRSSTAYTYSIDSIQEFQVSASNYSAEFGQAAGGVINAVTKSGGNTVHGDLFYFLRYPTLNALDPVAKANGVRTQAVKQQQQFGASVGGPAIKDKLFYFFTYDGSRRVFPITYTSTSFPLGAASPNLACPALVTPAACAAANAWLKSTVSAYGRTGVGDVAFGKLDYQLTSKNHLSGAFDWNNYHAPNGYNSATTQNNGDVSNNATLFTKTRIFVGNWDTTITNSMVNNFRFQWGVDNEIAGANGGGPQVAVTNVTQYGLNIALPRPAFPNEHRLQFMDTLSWTHGRHQIKAGVDVNAIHEVLINLFQGGAQYSYTTFANWVEDVTGTNVGDGLTGRHYSSFQQVNDPITGAGKDDFYNNDVAGFVEDTWKVRPNLTVNLGARYEIQMVPQPNKPNTFTPLTAATTTIINTDSNNWAPRVGLSWEPMKGTVVRAGYGMFYGKTSNSTWYAQRVENGVYQQNYTCLPTTATCAGLSFPNVLFTPPGPTPAAPFQGALTPQVTPLSLPLATQLVHGVQSDFVNPLIHEGDVTIERELPGNMSFTAAYVFSRGLHLPSFVDINVAPATTTHTYAVLNSAGGLVTSDTEPFYTTRLNPTTGAILTGKSNINSWYHGMLLTLRKPMSHGFEALINYTYSKSIDDGAVAGGAGISGTFFGTVPTTDPYNQKRENSLSDLDQRHRFVGSVVWAPRFEKVSNKVASAIVNGFSFAMVTTASSHQPLSSSGIAISGFPAGGVDYGLTGATITYTGGSTGGRPTWLGRNIYNGFPFYNTDFRIAREFKVWERVHMQFQADAFNLFNHTNIQGQYGGVNVTPYVFTNVGTGLCSGAVSTGTNGCLVPSPTFRSTASTTSLNGLYGARQLQVSAKITF